MDVKHPDTYFCTVSCCFIIFKLAQTSTLLILTRGVTSFALYCVLENKSIKSTISSVFLTDSPEAVKPAAAEGEAAIIAPRPAVGSSRTRPPSNTAEPCPLERGDRPGHLFPASFFLTARLKGPEPESLLEFRAPAGCSTFQTQARTACPSHRGCGCSC